ncbi:type I-E CRISPR-associated protein Cas5/CasD [Streptomyces lydicus]|uniref:type I-E CRISPR-associated protein Cas5/CasD n=1 Tax=Streptomyces lydicus TaxID=47763 RepID=UPI0036ECBE72
MTYTLLLRLEGILQAWGNRSHFHTRDTLPRPTKSGVIGLLAAADGHDRDEQRGEDDDFLPLETLAELRFGVRADRPGSLIEDFHTAGGGTYPLSPRDLITDPDRAQRAAATTDMATGPVFTSEAGHSLHAWYGAPKGIAPHKETRTLVAANRKRSPITSTRTYIADAAFLAGVQSDDRSLLRHLAGRLDAPQRLIWLGRKDCPPSYDVNLGIHPGDLETALTTAAALPRARPHRCNAWIECAPHTPRAQPISDQPLSFSPHRRTHAERWERRLTVTWSQT